MDQGTLPRYMTLQDIAEITRCSMSTIYKLSARGRIPGRLKTFGRMARYDRDIVLAWLKSQAETFTAGSPARAAEASEDATPRPDQPTSPCADTPPSS